MTNLKSLLTGVAMSASLIANAESPKYNHTTNNNTEVIAQTLKGEISDENGENGPITAEQAMIRIKEIEAKIMRGEKPFTQETVLKFYAELAEISNKLPNNPTAKGFEEMFNPQTQLTRSKGLLTPEQSSAIEDGIKRMKDNKLYAYYVASATLEAMKIDGNKFPSLNPVSVVTLGTTAFLGNSNIGTKILGQINITPGMNNQELIDIKNEIKGEEQQRKLAQVNQQSAQVNQQSTQLDQQSAQVNQQSTQVNQQSAQVNQQSAQVNQQSAQLDQQITELDQKLLSLDISMKQIDKNIAYLRSIADSSHKAFVELNSLMDQTASKYAQVKGALYSKDIKVVDNAIADLQVLYGNFLQLMKQKFPNKDEQTTIMRNMFIYMGKDKEKIKELDAKYMSIDDKQHPELIRKSYERTYGKRLAEINIAVSLLSVHKNTLLQNH